jgi:hypothetical protein
VAAHRVSPAARERAREFDAVACYTLNSLIEEDTNFDAYLDWLESERAARAERLSQVGRRPTVQLSSR